MKEFQINPNDAGQRLDKFITKITLSLPKSLLYKYIRLKKIKVNRKRCEPGQTLQEGDLVQLFLPPDFFGEEETPWKKLKPDLPVVWEDANLIICDKPIGLSCHSDETQKTNTLIDQIKAYLFRRGEYRPEEEQSFAPALCNRIDRNTSGLVICAKNAVALREMNAIIRDHLLEKRYLAWAKGKAEQKGMVTVYLKKDAADNRVMLSPVPKKGYLTAQTELFPLGYDSRRDRTLLEILLHTGRTHQIRATLLHLGHPLVGDSKYGSDRSDPDFAHQALRSQSLRFFPREDSPLFYLYDTLIQAPAHPLFSLKK
jgi:23S rRNA pseudouridine955/2504/2580 synthase